MSNNRIGEACWYNHKDKWKGGKLRAWSTDHAEFESGPGNYPVAVVEDDETQRCVVVYAERISFATVPPPR